MDASNETEPTQRLFFALWPDEPLRERLVRLQLERVEDGRFVRPRNLHMTLAFLGEVTAQAETCLCARAAEVEFEPFELSLDLLDYFSRPQIVWVGCSKVPAALDDLQESLCAAVRECLPNWQCGDFTPHVTLSRNASYHAPALLEPLRWTVDKICLVQSEPAEAGSNYEIVKVFDARR